MSFLETIRAKKVEEVRGLRVSPELKQYEQAIESNPPPVDVHNYFPRGRKHVIAEVKRASPSKGLIREGLDAGGLAREYETSGASAVSVLTDNEFFGGSNDDLRAVRGSIGIPVLRKDFIIDETQVIQSRALGADIVLLIVRLLDDERLRSLIRAAKALAMETLVEAHTDEDIRRGVDAGATLLGVNNRDLETFEVTRRTSLDLRGHIPPGILSVSESGIEGPGDAHELFDAGYDAVLVGESLVRASDRSAFIRQMVRS